MHPITVVNRHHPEHTYPHGETIYIGRGSPLGNPYPLGDYLTREHCIQDYEIYLKERILMRDSNIMAALKAIHSAAQDHPVNLQCFCAPKKCHGDSIKKLIETGDF